MKLTVKTLVERLRSDMQLALQQPFTYTEISTRDLSELLDELDRLDQENKLFGRAVVIAARQLADLPPSMSERVNKAIKIVRSLFSKARGGA